VISSKQRLFGEISDIAFAFHWPLDEILDLEHGVRRMFLSEIERIKRSASAR
jgi:hypothetical protein